MHVYEKWPAAAAQRDCHLRRLPDSARTVRERERGGRKSKTEGRKKENDSKKSVTWLSIDCSTTAHTTHVHTHTPASVLHIQANSTMWGSVFQQSKHVSWSMWCWYTLQFLFLSMIERAECVSNHAWFLVCSCQLPSLTHPSSSTSICFNLDQREVLNDTLTSVGLCRTGAFNPLKGQTYTACFYYYRGRFVITGLQPAIRSTGTSWNPAVLVADCIKKIHTFCILSHEYDFTHSCTAKHPLSIEVQCVLVPHNSEVKVLWAICTVMTLSSSLIGQKYVLKCPIQAWQKTVALLVRSSQKSWLAEVSSIFQSWSNFALREAKEWVIRFQEHIHHC